MIFYVQAPKAVMRELPGENAKVVSEAFFSEKVQRTGWSSGDKWFQIQSSDGYGGWVRAEDLYEREEPYPQGSSVRTASLQAHLYKDPKIEYGPILTLPFGSRLQVLDASDPRWTQVELPNGFKCYIQKGDVTQQDVTQQKEDLVSLSKRFLGLPYNWGGRTSCGGFDCSGFIQMLYRNFGIELKRDARDQILDERLRDVPTEMQRAGDLIFFGASKEKIQHVGMILYQHTFIHATSKGDRPEIQTTSLLDPKWTPGPDAHYTYRIIKRFEGACAIQPPIFNHTA